MAAAVLEQRELKRVVRPPVAVDRPAGGLAGRAHGWFSSDTTQSYLLTYNGKLTINELDRLIGLFRYRKDPLELLTLSACQTGIGDDRAALGLAGVGLGVRGRGEVALHLDLVSSAVARRAFALLRAFDDRSP